MGGIGARGRSTRYSSWKIGTNSGITNLEVSTLADANCNEEFVSDSLSERSSLASISFRFGAILALFVLVHVEIVRLLFEELICLVSKILSGVDCFFSREVKAGLGGKSI
jgi:hypothetical protein